MSVVVSCNLCVLYKLCTRPKASVYMCVGFLSGSDVVFIKVDVLFTSVFTTVHVIKQYTHSVRHNNKMTFRFLIKFMMIDSVVFK